MRSFLSIPDDIFRGMTRVRNIVLSEAPFLTAVTQFVTYYTQAPKPQVQTWCRQKYA